MLYESIALPLSYVGVAPTEYISGCLGVGWDLAGGAVSYGGFGAGRADAVRRVAILADDLAAGRIGATAERALPIHRPCHSPSVNARVYAALNEIAGS